MGRATPAGAPARRRPTPGPGAPTRSRCHSPTGRAGRPNTPAPETHRAAPAHRFQLVCGRQKVCERRSRWPSMPTDRAPPAGHDPRCAHGQVARDSGGGAVPGAEPAHRRGRWPTTTRLRASVTRWLVAAHRFLPVCGRHTVCEDGSAIVDRAGGTTVAEHSCTRPDGRIGGPEGTPGAGCPSVGCALRPRVTRCRSDQGRAAPDPERRRRARRTVGPGHGRAGSRPGRVTAGPDHSRAGAQPGRSQLPRVTVGPGHSRAGSQSGRVTVGPGHSPKALRASSSIAGS